MYQLMSIPSNVRPQTMSNYYKQEHNILTVTSTGVVEKKILITIDSSVYNLKITLCDEADVFFLYTVNITHDDYLSLKSEQGLLINFPEFPDQIVNLLKHSNSTKMFLQLSMVNTNCYYLEFIERNEFKNLIHLQLKLFPCDQKEVMRNISEKLCHYKDIVLNLEQKNELLRNEVQTVMKDNEKLCKGISEAENKIRKEYSELQHRYEIEHKKKCSEYEADIFKLQGEVQNLNSAIRDLTNSQKSLKSQNQQYLTTIDNLRMDITKLESDIKRHQYRENNFDSEIRDKDDEINSMRTKMAVLEQSLKEKNDIIVMLKDTLTKSEKEVEALRSSSALRSDQEMKLKLALQETSEDLHKANEIITKTNQNYDQLKKKNNVVSKILINLEKEHTQLQKDFSEKMKAISLLQTKLDSQASEIKIHHNEQERLLKMLRTKDENIAELKRIVEIQHEKLRGRDEEKLKENIPLNKGILPVSEWEPIPSPGTPKNQPKKKGSPLVQNNKPLLLSRRNDIPSSYFNPSAGMKNTKKC